MAESGDMKAHSHTYEGFIAMCKWGTIAAAFFAALVVYLISN